MNQVAVQHFPLIPTIFPTTRPDRSIRFFPPRIFPLPLVVRFSTVASSCVTPRNIPYEIGRSQECRVPRKRQFVLDNSKAEECLAAVTEYLFYYAIVGFERRGESE